MAKVISEASKSGISGNVSRPPPTPPLDPLLISPVALSTNVILMWSQYFYLLMLYGSATAPLKRLLFLWITFFFQFYIDLQFFLGHNQGHITTRIRLNSEYMPKTSLLIAKTHKKKTQSATSRPCLKRTIDIFRVKSGVFMLIIYTVYLYLEGI